MRSEGDRSAKSNLSIICNDLSAISEYAKVSTPLFKLMKRNLPGPFTFILPTTSSLPRIYKNKKTVGIRVPDNNIIREIVAQLGNPVLSTTVKDEDEEVEYITDPELIHEKWGDIADIVIDGGPGGIEGSTGSGLYYRRTVYRPTRKRGANFLILPIFWIK